MFLSAFVLRLQQNIQGQRRYDDVEDREATRRRGIRGSLIEWKVECSHRARCPHVFGPICLQCALSAFSLASQPSKENR